MQTYIAILRGINVSGQKKILMADLKKLLEELGFKQVTTYIQSGNVVFKTSKKATDAALAKSIEDKIAEKYHFQVPVLVRTEQEWNQCIQQNPFLKNASIDIEKLHVTFLDELPESSKIEALKAFEYTRDEFIINGKEIYLHCPINYGETKLSNQFFENKLKVRATTRNWKTVNKLTELAAQLA